MRQYAIIEDPETGEELEIEVEIEGGFAPATWGYGGGTPAEVPYVSVLSDLPKGIDEQDIIERVLDELQQGFNDYDDRYDPY